MDLPSLEATITEKLRTTALVIKTPDGERAPTLQELREALAPLGLDVTTRSAEAWGISNPIQADHIDQICDLTQQLDDLSLQKKPAE